MGFAVAIFGGVEGAFLDIECGLGADPHGREDRSVQVGDADRIFDGEAGTLGGGFAVEMSLFDAAAEHHYGRCAGEVAVQAVVLHLFDDLRRGSGLIDGGRAGNSFNHHVAAKFAGDDDERPVEQSFRFEI